jgi:hypothetical protein
MLYVPVIYGTVSILLHRLHALPVGDSALSDHIMLYPITSYQITSQPILQYSNIPPLPLPPTSTHTHPRSTGANQESSRSHQVMQLCLREKVATGPPTMVGPGRRKVSAPAQPKVRLDEIRR